MSLGISLFMALKSIVLYQIFAYLKTQNHFLLALPFLHASIVSVLISISSHPSINFPMLLCKSSDGSFPLWSLITFSPFFIFIRMLYVVRRFCSGEEAYSEIFEGLYVGAWPCDRSKMPPGNPAIVDCTCEFPRKSEFEGQLYLCVPAWDTRALLPQQIDAAVTWACRVRAQGKPVFVHCAYGHGRSVSVMCAMLVALGAAEDLKNAENFVFLNRPYISLNSLHRTSLKEWSSISQKMCSTKGKWISCIQQEINDSSP